MENFHKHKVTYISLVAIIVIVIGVFGLIHHHKTTLNGTYYYDDVSANHKLSTLTIKHGKWIEKHYDGTTRDFTSPVKFNKDEKTFAITNGNSGSYTYNPKNGKLVITFSGDDSGTTLAKKGSSLAKERLKEEETLKQRKKFFESGKLNGTWVVEKTYKYDKMFGYLSQVVINGKHATENIKGIPKHSGGFLDNGKRNTVLAFVDSYDDGYEKYPSDVKTVFQLKKAGKRDPDYTLIYRNNKLYAYEGGVMQKPQFVLVRK